MPGPFSFYSTRPVRVGDTHLYGSRPATKEEIYNVSIKNVVGGGLYVLSLAGEIGNLTLHGIRAVNGAGMLHDERTPAGDR